MDLAKLAADFAGEAGPVIVLPDGRQMGLKHGQVLGRKGTDGVIIFQYQSSCLFMVGELSRLILSCGVLSSAELRVWSSEDAREGQTCNNTFQI